MWEPSQGLDLATLLLVAAIVVVVIVAVLVFVVRFKRKKRQSNVKMTFYQFLVTLNSKATGV
jgi:Flp pilus assembly protein TadB